MACSIPVVATGVGGVTELVCDGVTGRVLPARAIDLLARAVCELAADASMRAAMGAAGRARVLRRFDGRQQVDRIAEVMSRLCGFTAPARSDVARPAGGISGKNDRNGAPLRIASP